MELFKDTHLVKLELLSNETTIDSALNYIRNKQQQEEEQHRELDIDSTTTTKYSENGLGSLNVIIYRNSSLSMVKAACFSILTVNSLN
jgi:hypothetical protein